MVNNGALAGLEVAQMGRGLAGVPAQPWQGVSRPAAEAAARSAVRGRGRRAVYTI